MSLTNSNPILLVSCTIAAFFFGGTTTFSQMAFRLNCEVSRKVDNERNYSEEDIARFKPSVRLTKVDNRYLVERCSFSPSQNRENCDPYQIDFVQSQEDPPMSKYYYYRGMFDLQVFGNGFFVENNGRGTISYGTCKIHR